MDEILDSKKIPCAILQAIGTEVFGLRNRKRQGLRLAARRSRVRCSGLAWKRVHLNISRKDAKSPRKMNDGRMGTTKHTKTDDD
jgi:hypothetical protein